MAEERPLMHHPEIQCRVRVARGIDIAVGPGKMELLEAIRDAGSISGGARRMGMSYRRAWMLVETMNSCFAQPLVATSTGGRAGGGGRPGAAAHGARAGALCGGSVGWGASAGWWRR
jgi:molybdate transport system regulatory protein